MKYILSINKGRQYRDWDRYVNIDLGQISPDLAKDNNLLEICSFTMQFPNVIALKGYLAKLGLISSKQAHFDLSITYTIKERTMTLEVPYQSHLKFFSINYLCDSISENCEKNKKFAISFLYLIKDMRGLDLRHYNDLKLYADGYKNDLKPDPIVRAIIKDIIKRDNKLSYRSLFDLAMLVYKMVEEEKQKEMANPPVITDLNRLSEAEAFKAEEWGLTGEAKDDSNQYKLF